MSNRNGSERPREEDDEEMITGDIDEDDRPRSEPPAIERRTARKTSVPLPPRRPIRTVRKFNQSQRKDDSDEDEYSSTEEEDDSVDDSSTEEDTDDDRGEIVDVIFKNKQVTVGTKKSPAKPKTQSTAMFGRKPTSESFLPNDAINRISSIVRGGQGGSAREDKIKSFIQEAATWTTFEELFSEGFFKENCKVCDIDFTSKSEFLTHEPCYTNKRQMRESFINGPTKPFDCEVCQKEFDTLDELIKHSEFHFTMRYKCNICSVGFKVCEHFVNCYVS